jgi:uncharacterized protein YdaU (DUF1376 family)
MKPQRQRIPVLGVFVADIVSSCVDMTNAQFGAYHRLLYYAWEHGGLPNDLQTCCRIGGGMDPCDWPSIRRRLVVLDEGTAHERLSHPRLERERKYAIEQSDKRKEAARKAAEARWDDASVMRDACVTHCDSHANGMRDALQTHCDSYATLPLPLPHTQDQEKQQAAPVVPTDVPQKRSRPRKRDALVWTPEAGWQGVGDSDRSQWAVAYPACDLRAELARMHQWLLANPAKSHKKKWRAFVVRWLARSQEKGGSVASRRPEDAQRQPVVSTLMWRDDACRNMTDEQYAAWRAKQQYAKEGT